MAFVGYPWVLMGILDDHSTNQRPVKYSSSFAGVQAQIASRYLLGGSNEVLSILLNGVEANLHI